MNQLPSKILKKLKGLKLLVLDFTSASSIPIWVSPTPTYSCFFSIETDDHATTNAALAIGGAMVIVVNDGGIAESIVNCVGC